MHGGSISDAIIISDFADEESSTKVEEENKKRKREGKGNRDGEDAIKQASVKDSHEDLMIEYEDGSSERINRFERY